MFFAFSTGNQDLVRSVSKEKEKKYIVNNLMDYQCNSDFEKNCRISNTPPNWENSMNTESQNIKQTLIIFSLSMHRLLELLS